MRRLLAAAGAGLLVAGVVWLRRRYVLVTVVGTSMTPTLQPGDRVLVQRVPLGRIRRGDLVVVAPPTDLPSLSDDPPWLVKRAVALPGDPVPAGAPPSADGLVPAGALFILGDNTAHSYDSRRAGFFPADRLLGVVVRQPARS